MRKIALSLLMGLAITPASVVHALGLGEIELNSALNQSRRAGVREAP